MNKLWPVFVHVVWILVLEVVPMTLLGSIVQFFLIGIKKFLVHERSTDPKLLNANQNESLHNVLINIGHV